MYYMLLDKVRNDSAPSELKHFSHGLMFRKLNVPVTQGSNLLWLKFDIR